MEIEFSKYQGAGNDFIMVDDREEKFPVKDYALIEKLCDRHFGIGADGLILLQNAQGYDFRMLYYNSDGKPSTFCGNGGRCIAAFAKELGISHRDTEAQRQNYSFIATDGPHKASWEGDEIALEMKNVETISDRGDDLVLNTGSPHYVRFIRENQDLEEMDIISPAKAIRFNDEFRMEGINVNFVQVEEDNHIKVRTYERGVENETLACGTGVVASAIAYFEYYGSEEDTNLTTVTVDAAGGKLKVRFRHNDGKYHEIALIGKAEKVFKGKINP